MSLLEAKYKIGRIKTARLSCFAELTKHATSYSDRC